MKLMRCPLCFEEAASHCFSDTTVVCIACSRVWNATASNKAKIKKLDGIWMYSQMYYHGEYGAWQFVNQLEQHILNEMYAAHVNLVLEKELLG